MGKYWYIFRSSLRDNLFYRSKLVSTIIMWVLRVAILFMIYSYTFSRHGSSIQGMNATTTIWSIAMYFLVLSLSIRHVYRDISEDIRLGLIETKLNKPFNYLLYSLLMRFGRGLPNLFFSILAIIPFLLYFAGVPELFISVSWLAAAVLLFIGGLVVGSLLYMLIGLTAIWIDDADPVYWIFDKTIMILGGAYIPTALFPASVRLLAEHTPFGATMFITHIFNPNFADRASRLLLVQLVWTLFLGLAVSIMFQRANKRLSIHGG